MVKEIPRAPARTKGTVRSSGSSLSKTIGRLNKSGVLQQSLSYSDCIGPLSALGDRAAEQLLSELEFKGSSIKDPTNWLCAAASRTGSGKSAGGKAVSKGGPARSAGFSKTIGWLNKSGALQQPISFSDVVGPLSALGDAAAEQLLAELEEKGMSVKDPTNWLCAAAARSGGGKSFSKGYATMPSVQSAGRSSFSKTIGWLNKSGALQQPISFSDVVGPLSALGDAGAEQLLAELEEKGHSVKDPTNWLCAAASRSGGGKSFSKGYAPMPTAGKSGGKGGGSWVQVQTSSWVSKAIGQLNNSDKLKEPIDWSSSIGILSALPDSVAIGLVKELESKADEINKPTAWLATAAKKCANSGKRSMSSTISKKVGALNKSDKLKEPLSWSDCSGPLLLMEEADAEALIDELEDKAGEVKNPTAWLISAAEKKGRKRARP